MPNTYVSSETSHRVPQDSVYLVTITYCCSVTHAQTPLQDRTSSDAEALSQLGFRVIQIFISSNRGGSRKIMKVKATLFDASGAATHQ